MSSRREGHRRERKTASHRQQQYGTDENWTLKPILDHDIQPDGVSSSVMNPEEELRGPQNRRYSWPAHHNRGRKSRFRNKSQKEDYDDSSGAKPDSVCGDPNEKQEGCAASSDRGSSLGSGNCEGITADSGKGKENVSSSNGVDVVGSDNGEVFTADSGKRKEKVVEVRSSSNEFDEDETSKRLQELMLNVEEPELSDELLSINHQLQEDELLAMESIYGDNIFILQNQSGLNCFQAHIHVEVPKGLHVTAKLNSLDLLEKSCGASSDFLYAFQVEYLPPIILTCLLPKSYPSKCAPYFTISVQWLGSAKISDLCSKLDSIWIEQSGQEVIYQWVEWLHSCTLSYLGFDSEIVLGPYGVIHHEDIRAVSGSISPNIDIPLIKSYNDEQRHENFCRNIQECSICFSECAGSEFIRLPCQHFFCEKCLKTFSDMHISEGTVQKLHCPEAKCEVMIPPGLLKRLLGEQEFERWESLMLQKTLESMSDVVYCPRCETACLEDEGDHAQCSKCYYSFCTLCWDRRHVGVACMAPEIKLALLQERQNSTKLKGEQMRREQDMINQILSLKEINRSAKQCPTCKMAISRTEGCNKMVCDNCGQYFCYRCNQTISGYEHFRDGACELFPTEEIQRWEERMNPRQAVGQVQAQLFADRGHACPNCGQPNLKAGNNNHIFCWACQNHYCYLCRKMVRRSSLHFGPKGCKQHTAG